MRQIIVLMLILGGAWFGVVARDWRLRVLLWINAAFWGFIAYFAYVNGGIADPFDLGELAVFCLLLALPFAGCLTGEIRRIVRWFAARRVSSDNPTLSGDQNIGSEAMPIAPPREIEFDLNETPDYPQCFGYKFRWMAIRSEDADGIIQLLGLTDLRRSNWQSGLRVAYECERRVFISPPVQGWTFVAGDLPRDGDGGAPDCCTPVLLALGKQYPRVCYFASHRGVDYYAWALIENGEVVRQFGVGEGCVFWDEGSITPEEDEEDMHFDEESLEDESPDEEHVLAIAARWSIDNRALEEMELEAGTGYVCLTPDNWQ